MNTTLDGARARFRSELRVAQRNPKTLPSILGSHYESYLHHLIGVAADTIVRSVLDAAEEVTDNGPVGLVTRRFVTLTRQILDNGAVDLDEVGRFVLRVYTNDDPSYVALRPITAELPELYAAAPRPSIDGVLRKSAAGLGDAPLGSRNLDSLIQVIEEESFSDWVSPRHDELEARLALSVMDAPDEQIADEIGRVTRICQSLSPQLRAALLNGIPEQRRQLLDRPIMSAELVGAAV